MDRWINSELQSLIIEVDDLNFAERPEDLGKVIDKIQAELNGLF
jgi:deoxyadenosine/deoxycytidine kinase